MPSFASQRLLYTDANPNSEISSHKSTGSLVQELQLPPNEILEDKFPSPWNSGFSLSSGERGNDQLSSRNGISMEIGPVFFSIYDLKLIEHKRVISFILEWTFGYCN